MPNLRMKILAEVFPALEKTRERFITYKKWVTEKLIPEDSSKI